MSAANRSAYLVSGWTSVLGIFFLERSLARPHFEAFSTMECVQYVRADLTALASVPVSWCTFVGNAIQ